MSEGASFGEAIKSPQGKVVVVGGVAVVGYLYWRSRQSTAAPTASTAGMSDTSSTGGMDTGGGSGGGGAFGDSAGSTSATVGNAAPAPTNASWVQGAVNYLSGLGRDPSTVLDALGRYVSGTSTSADMPIIQSALASQGATPFPVAAQSTMGLMPPIVSNPGPVAGTTQTKGTLSYIVQKGDTQAKINKMFGIHVEALNPILNHKGSKIHAGQKIVI